MVIEKYHNILQSKKGETKYVMIDYNDRVGK